jgi:hypothetical protein
MANVPSSSRPTVAVGPGAVAAVAAGAAMGVLVGVRVACHVSSWMGGLTGCPPGGGPLGALAGALLALAALPLLREGTRRGSPAGHPPAPTTTAAVRLVWLAIAAALGRWLTEWALHPQMGLEGLALMAILPPLLAAVAVLAAVAAGLRRRRGWARWTAVVGFSLLGVTALFGLVEWAVAMARSPDAALEPPLVDLFAPLVFLVLCAGVVGLLLAPATRGDFRSPR